jgi:transposase-like protein
MSPIILDTPKVILYLNTRMSNPFDFKTLAEFFEYFKDEQTAVEFFTNIRFRTGKYCPHCGHTSVHLFSDGKRYRCGKCKQDFTIKTGTVFGESKLPIKTWFAAIYLLSTSNKGISSVQLAKQLGVTQKTAWFMDHRIREVMKQGKSLLSGTIEMDETYIGGQERNKHRSKQIRGTQGRSTKTKTPVIGMAQRGGQVRAEASDRANMRQVEKLIVRNAAIGSKLHTDQFNAYSHIGRLFSHQIVNHAAGQYVTAGDVHTNTIESFWALFKRGFHGVYHQMSRKHLQRYVDECTYRWNVRPADLKGVFADVVERVAGSRQLSYNALTEKAA